MVPQGLPWLSPSSSPSELEEARKTDWQALWSIASTYLLMEGSVKAVVLLHFSERADVGNAASEVHACCCQAPAVERPRPSRALGYLPPCSDGEHGVPAQGHHWAPVAGQLLSH